jgi:hypothetical protein
VEEMYILGQKGYERTDTVPVIDEEKAKHTKYGTHRSIINFLEGHIKNKKSKSFYIPMTYL